MAELPTSIPSDRLEIREWRPSDAAALGEAIHDSLEHLEPWMSWTGDEPISVVDRAAMIDTWRQEREEGGDLVVGALDNGVVVGAGGLHWRSGPDTLEIGYWVRAGEIRKGVATEIASALTTAAFTVPEVEHVEIKHDKANVASGGVPNRLGYEWISETVGDTQVDWCWRISRDSWAP